MFWGKQILYNSYIFIHRYNTRFLPWPFGCILHVENFFWNIWTSERKETRRSGSNMNFGTQCLEDHVFKCFFTGCYLRIHGIFSTAMFTRETFLQFVTIMHVFWLEGGCSNPSIPGEPFGFLMPEFSPEKPDSFCISDKKNKHLKLLIFWLSHLWISTI